MKSVVNCRDPLNQLRVQKRMISLNKKNVTCIQMVQPEVMPKANALKKHFSSWISKKNKVHVAKTKPINMPATFQESLRATLLIGQAFGLMPVAGLLRYDQKGVRFNWMSWRCLHSYLLLCGQSFTTLMCIYNMSHSESALKNTTPAIFYATTCITMAMFLQVASNLPKLTKHVIQTEDLDPNFDANFKFKCNMTCAVVLILALFEHILSLVSAYTGAMMCYPDIHMYEGFVKQSYPWIFKFLPYSTVLGITIQFLHFQATFIWNFSDLFVIVMSYYLTSRLENLNKKLILAQGKYVSELFWRTTREEYGRATQLVRKVDEVINGIVFISFANNLFFVCLQLFNTLEDGIKGTEECRGNRHRYGKSPFGGYEAAAYFLFSLVYLICRSVAVSLIASQVNTASTVPAPVLYDVPSPVYCIEVQRFIEHVNGEKVALSGLQFFTVTRGLLLTRLPATTPSSKIWLNHYEQIDGVSLPHSIIFLSCPDALMKPTHCTHKVIKQNNILLILFYGGAGLKNKIGKQLCQNLMDNWVAGTIVTYELVMFQFKTQQPTFSPTVTNMTVA